MIALLLITTLFVVISVYFFFRAEKFQRALIVLNRDTAKAQKEKDMLTKSMANIAGNNEEFIKNRFQRLMNKVKCQQTSNDLTLISPMINNYAFIFKACLIKKGVLHSTTKKTFSSLGDDAYKNFIESIVKKDTKIQRLWNHNNFNGFICLVEALIVKYEQQSQEYLNEEKTTETVD